jgi:hypothetical protein
MPLDLGETHFHGDLDLSELSLRDVLLESAKIEGAVRLRAALVDGDLVLNGAELKHLSLRSAVIEGDADFTGLKVLDSGDFLGTTFKGVAMFASSRFMNNGAVFTGTKAVGLDLGPDSPSTAWRRWKRSKGIEIAKGERAFWQFALGTYSSLGDRERADAAHFYERSASYADAVVEAKGRSRPAYFRARLDQYIAYCFWNGLIGYGTSVSRALFGWLVAAIGFACLYAALPAVFGRPDPHIFTWANWREALFMSMRVFVKIGTASIATVPPAGQVLLCSYAAASTVLITVFVAVVTRKVMR